MIYLFEIVCWECVLFATDDSDTEEDVKEEEESIGKKEGAPPVSNEVQAMAWFGFDQTMSCHVASI